MSQIRLQISLESQQHIVAKRRPGVISHTTVYHLPVRRLIVLPRGIFHLSCNTTLNQISRTHRTVVVEIIIAVHLVLWLQILYQGLFQGHLLLWRQVQHLFGDAAATAFIFLSEERVGVGSQFIVSQSEDKPSHKIRFLKVKHTPVERDILSFRHIMPPQGRMSVQAVNLLMWRTRQQTHLDGVVRQRFHRGKQ